MALALRFRAKSNMTIAEAERRLAAAAAAPSVRPALPPSMIADRLAPASEADPGNDHQAFVRALNGALDQDELPAAAGCGAEPISPSRIDPAATEDEAIEPAPHPAAAAFFARPRPEPDFPVVTITIAGPRRGGKSVIAHLIRSALAREGIVAEGPAGLRSLAWHRALETLRERGIGVVLRRDDETPGEGT